MLDDVRVLRYRSVGVGEGSVTSDSHVNLRLNIPAASLIAVIRSFACLCDIRCSQFRLNLCTSCHVNRGNVEDNILSILRVAVPLTVFNLFRYLVLVAVRNLIAIGIGIVEQLKSQRRNSAIFGFNHSAACKVAFCMRIQDIAVVVLRRCSDYRTRYCGILFGISFDNFICLGCRIVLVVLDSIRVLRYRNIGIGKLNITSDFLANGRCRVLPVASLIASVRSITYCYDIICSQLRLNLCASLHVNHGNVEDNVISILLFVPLTVFNLFRYLVLVAVRDAVTLVFGVLGITLGIGVVEQLERQLRNSAICIFSHSTACKVTCCMRIQHITSVTLRLGSNGLIQCCSISFGISFDNFIFLSRRIVLVMLDVVRILLRNPLCIQMQFGHQNSSCIRKFVGACCFGIPTTKGVTLRSLERITVTNSIGVATHPVFYDRILVLSKNPIIGIVGIISDINRNALEIAINMDILYPVPTIPFALVLNGIPYDFNTIWSERKIVGVEQRISCSLIGIGLRCIRTIVPVFRSEETEVLRNAQVFFVNTVLDIGNRLCAGNSLHAFRSYIAAITSIRIQTLYATVAALDTGSLVIAARQVVFLALVTVILRRITLRQKHEVLSFLLMIPCEIALELLHVNCIRRRIAYCIIILRIIFIGTAIIASLLDVRTAGWCLCRILSLRLSLGPSIGSLNGVFCGSTVNNRHLVFRCRKGGDAFIVGQRPGRAHGQRHDSRKCSCEQTFTHILF